MPLFQRHSRVDIKTQKAKFHLDQKQNIPMPKRLLIEFDIFSCGEDVKCYPIPIVNTLTVDGKGPMKDFKKDNPTLIDFNYYVTAITFQGTVSSIGAYAFYKADKLTTININSPITEIRTGAFAGCTKLSSVTFPNTLTTIGDMDSAVGAFEGCTQLSSIFFQAESQVITIGKQSFSGCSNLGKTNLPKSILTICSHAFFGCSSMSNVAIEGSSLLLIEDYGFAECTAMQTINLPQSLTSLGNHVFEQCTSLLVMMFPQYLTTIHSYTFSGCSKLYSILFPDELELIEEAAFKDCSALTVVVVTPKVTEIQDNSFGFCLKLESITLPDSLTKIGEGAFRFCSALKSIDIPNKITSIQDYLFIACTDLASIVFPESLTTIGSYSFSTCSSLRSISLPSHVQTIGNCAFSDCTALETFTFTDPAPMTAIGTSAFSGCESLKSFIYPPLITTVENKVFQECISLKTVTFLGSVTSIGSNSFEGCSMLQMTIPPSVTRIGDYAFTKCSFKYLLFSNNLQTIGNYAFQHCFSLENIVISKSIVLIGDGAFSLCPRLSVIIAHVDNEFYTTKDNVLFNKALTSILIYPTSKPDASYSIPYGVTTISAYSFSSCVYLKTLYIPSSVNAFEDYSFVSVAEVTIYYYGSKSYSSLNIDPPLKVIVLSGYSGSGGILSTKYFVEDKKIGFSRDSKGDSRTGKECGDKLTCTFELENKQFVVTGTGAMKDSDSVSKWYTNTKLNIETVIFDDSVTTVGKSTFTDCQNLKNVYLGKSIQKIMKSAFSGCTSLKSIHIPSSVTLIQESAFDGCTSLVNISIEDGLQSIEKRGFYSCSSLSTIILPSTLIFIGAESFQGCSSLSTIVYCGETDFSGLSSDTFSGTSALKAYVTFAYLNKYSKFSSLSVGQNNKVNTFNIASTIVGITDKNIQTQIRISIIGATMFITGRGSIKNYDDLEYLEWKNYKADLEELNIAAGVISLGNKAFYECSKLQRLYLGETVKFIGVNTFYKCNIKELTIRKAVEVIGFYSIETDTALSNTDGTEPLKGTFGENSITKLQIEAGSSLKIIGDYSFQQNSFSSLSLPSSFIYIGNYAFTKNQITTLVFAQEVGLSIIGDYSFYNCPQLHEMNSIPENVVSIGKGPFSKTSLPSIPVNVNSLYYVTENDILYTLQSPIILIQYPNAKQVKDVTISDKAPTIAQSAFEGSLYIETITIPAAIKDIQPRAFSSCPKLVSFSVNPDNTNYKTYDDILFTVDDDLIQYPSNKAENTYVLTKGTTLWENSFADAQNLEALILPPLARINSLAFSNTKLKNITYEGLANPDSASNIFEGTNDLIVYTYSNYVGSTFCGKSDPYLKKTFISKYFSGSIQYPQVYSALYISPIDGRIEHQLLVFYGKGEVKETAANQRDWVSSVSNIYSVIICKGITTIPSYGFSGCSLLSEVILGGEIKYIGSHSFEECSLLQSFFLQSSITAIQDYTFYKCTSLTSITLHNNLLTIGAYSFSECAFSTLSFSATITSIGQGAFENCAQLTSVTFNGELDTIGMSAFTKCTLLQSLTFKKLVNSIGKASFKGCESLSTLSFEKGVGSIGEQAFNGCKSILSLGFSTIGSIGKEAFTGCSKLATVTFYTGITTIGESAFQDLTSLTTCTIYGDIQTIGASAFKGCSKLKSPSFTTTITTIGDQAFESCTTFDGISFSGILSSIGELCFSGCSNLVSVQFHRGVGVIGKQAFKDCNKLESVLSSEAVETIGESAFQGLKALSTSSFHGTIGTIGKSAFQGCTSIGALSFSSKITTIDEMAFKDCSNMESLILQNGADTIGKQAFFGCNKIDYITVNGPIGTIGESAFQDLIGLTRLTIQGAITTMGVSAFRGCSQLSTCTLNGNIYSIQESAFKGCSSLPSITLKQEFSAIPDSLFEGCSLLATLNLYGSVSFTSVGNSAFKGCSFISSKSLAFTKNVNIIGSSAFENCISVTSLTFDQDIQSIGEAAFKGCSFLPSLSLKLTSSVIPDSLFEGCSLLSALSLSGPIITKIGNSAFKGCSVITRDSLIWTSNTQFIGNSAFQDCIGLESISFRPSLHVVIEQIGSHAFSGCNHLSSCTFTGLVIQSLGEAAFQGCSLLSQLTFIHQFTTIPDNAFEGCSSLSVLKFTGTSAISTIGKSAFKGCELLSELSLNHEFTTIPESLFEGCSALATLILSGTGVITTIENSSFKGCCLLTSASLTFVSNVNSIGNSAFLDCSSIESLTFKPNIALIGSKAFDGCLHLTTCTFNGHIQTIGESAFKGCSSLLSMKLKNEFTTIPDSLFEGCSSLTRVIFSEATEITSIGNSAFKGCSHLVYNIPYSVQQIGSYAFSKCLVRVLLCTNNLRSIGDYAFKQCSQLENIAISKTLESIGEGAFSLCSKLSVIIAHLDNPNFITRNNVLFSKDFKTLLLYPSGNPGETYSIPYSVKTIASGAFYSCTYLRTLFIPGSVTIFQDDSFKSVSELTIYYYGPTSYSTLNIDTPKAFIIPTYAANSNKFKLSESPTSQAQKFTGSECGAQLTCIFEAESKQFIVTGEGDMTDFPGESTPNPLNHPWYSQAENIETILIDDSVTSIGTSAFSGCTNLKSLYIGRSVQKISNYAFYGCSSLKILNVPKSVKIIGSHAFYQCGLVNISIEDGLTEIQSSAFGLCTSLPLIVLPSTLATLGSQPFYSCSNLLAIVYCGEHDFSQVSNSLKSLCPDELVIYTTEAYNNKYSTFCGETVSNNNKVQVINIKSSIMGITLNSIETQIRISVLSQNSEKTVMVITGEGTIKNYESTDEIEWKDYLAVIDELNIGGGITSIGDKAFYGCSKLQQIYLGETIRSIGSNTFFKCNIKSLMIKNTIEMIGFYNIEETDGTFGDNLITKLDFQDSSTLRIIGDYSFQKNTINSLSLPSSLIIVGRHAFEQSQNLKLLSTAQTSLTTYGDHSFSQSSNLQRIAIGAQQIDNGAFKDLNILSLKLYTPNVFVAENAFQGSLIRTISYYGTTDIDSQAFSHLSTVVIYVPQDYTQNVFCGFSNLIKDLTEHTEPFTNYNHYSKNSLLLFALLGQFFLSSNYIIDIVKQ